MNRLPSLQRNMEFQFTVLLFLAVILNNLINITESMDEPAAKERIKNKIKKMIEKGIKVDQHHFNQLADKEVLRAEAKIYKTHMQEGLRAWPIYDWLVEHGLYAYGPVYDRIRSHGAMDLTGPKEEIANIVNSKIFSREEKKQQYIKRLARQKTLRLLEREHVNLIRDGYSPGTINRLLEQRGLLEKGRVYEELCQPFKPIIEQSMDLKLSKDKILNKIKRMKGPHRIISKDNYEELAHQEGQRLLAEYLAIAEKELPENEIYQRGLPYHPSGGVGKKLNEPPSILDPKKQATKRGRFFERGEGSFSKP